MRTKKQVTQNLMSVKKEIKNSEYLFLRALKMSGNTKDGQLKIHPAIDFFTGAVISSLVDIFKTYNLDYFIDIDSTTKKLKMLVF